MLFSLLGSVGALVPMAIFMQGETPPEGLFLGAALIAVGVSLLSFDHAQSK